MADNQGQGNLDEELIIDSGQFSLRGTRNKIVIGLGIAFVVAFIFSGFPSNNDLFDWFFIFNLVIAGIFFVIGGIRDFGSNSAFGSAIRYHYSSEKKKKDSFSYQFKFWRFGTAGEYLLAAAFHLILSLVGSRLYWLYFKPA